MLRLLVLLGAIAMPLVNALAIAGVFGADVGAMSKRYPTLIVAAGYAFSIWGPIFALVLMFGVYQALPARANDALLQRLRAPAALAFALTATWTPIFIHAFFWISVLVLFTTFGLLSWCLLQADAAWSRTGADRWLVWPAFSVFTAWVSLAAFLNLAQALVAYRIDLGIPELAWSVVLLLLAAGSLLFVNQRLRGNLLYVATALWALVAIWVEQTRRGEDDSQTTAWLALAIAAVLVAHYASLHLRGDPFERRRFPRPAG